MGKRRPKISQSQMAKQPGQGNLISRRHKKHNLKVQNSNFRAVSPNVTDGGPQGKKENQEKVTSPTMSPNSEKNLTEAEIQVIHYSKYLKISQKGYKSAVYLGELWQLSKSKQLQNTAKFPNETFCVDFHSLC